MFEDRTKCHADHVGQGFDRLTTAAVGVLKAVHCGQEYGFYLIHCFEKNKCRDFFIINVLIKNQ